MTRREALEKLGLDDAAAPGDIERAFRAAVKAAHPDTATEQSDLHVSELVDAREKALGISSTETLVPLNHVTDLVRIFSQDIGDRRRMESNSDKAVRQVVVHHMGRLAHQRRRRLTLAVISGALTALIAVLEATTKFDFAESPQETKSVSVVAVILMSVFGLTAALLGIAAWNISAREKRLQLEIEEAAEALSDRGTFLDVLEEIGTASNHAIMNGWTRTKLIEAIQQWTGNRDEVSPTPFILHELFPGSWDEPKIVPLKSIAAIIGPVDFARLMIVKGLEHGLIAERLVEIDGRRSYQYELALTSESM